MLEHYLPQAYELAFFIHPDKNSALDVAKRALAKLEVAANSQFKRYYYTPTGRSADKGESAHRTKVNFGESQLLQRLVYIESEVTEKQQEQHEQNMSQVDMVIRFVKHIVKTTLRRNSFM